MPLYDFRAASTLCSAQEMHKNALKKKKKDKGQSSGTVLQNIPKFFLEGEVQATPFAPTGSEQRAGVAAAQLPPAQLLLPL